MSAQKGLAGPLPALVPLGLWLLGGLALAAAFALAAPGGLVEALAVALPLAAVLGAQCVSARYVVAAVPLGVAAAVRPGSWRDGLAQVVALLGQALPAYWVGLVLIVVLSVRLGLLPVAVAVRGIDFHRRVERRSHARAFPAPVSTRLGAGHLRVADHGEIAPDWHLLFHGVFSGQACGIAHGAA